MATFRYHQESGRFHFRFRWSYAKRLHRLCRGVDRENFPLYLAVYEFRFNHCGDRLLAILFDRLYKPGFIKGRLS